MRHAVSLSTCPPSSCPLVTCVDHTTQANANIRPFHPQWPVRIALKVFPVPLSRPYAGHRAWPGGYQPVGLIGSLIQAIVRAEYANDVRTSELARTSRKRGGDDAPAPRVRGAVRAPYT